MITWEQFAKMQIGDFVEYKVWADPRPVGSVAKVIRRPCMSVWILLLMPYKYESVEFESGQMLIAGRNEIIHHRKNYRWLVVEETIRQIHPKSLLSGHILRIVPKNIVDISIDQQLALYNERTDLIKVEFSGQWWFVEPEYCTFIPF